MPKSSITAIIITNRSDERFERALASVQWADAVLIVDNQSAADWKSLEKKFHFSLFSRENKIKNFAQARNDIIFHVKTEWVLMLDSDEMLPETAVSEIRTLIESDFYDVLQSRRIDYFWGVAVRFGEPSAVLLTRLFKKEQVRFHRAVHEVAVPKPSARIGMTEFKIDHFSHENMTSFLQKVIEYAKIEASTRNAKPELYTKRRVLLELCSFPMGKFLYNYIVLLGFLDGYRGFVYALMMSLHSFFVRVFLYEKQNT